MGQDENTAGTNDGHRSEGRLRWPRYLAIFLVLWFLVSMAWIFGAIREAKRIKQQQERPDAPAKQ